MNQSPLLLTIYVVLSSQLPFVASFLTSCILNLSPGIWGNIRPSIVLNFDFRGLVYVRTFQIGLNNALLCDHLSLAASWTRTYILLTSQFTLRYPPYQFIDAKPSLWSQQPHGTHTRYVRHEPIFRFSFYSWWEFRYVGILFHVACIDEIRSLYSGCLGLWKPL